MAHGDYTHIELPTDDLERGRRFYEGLFGWTFESNEFIPGYYLYRTPSGTFGGGMGMRGTTAPEAIRDYVEVTSIDNTLAHVSDLGGSVVAGKDEIPGIGWWAAVKDSEGNEIGLFQPLPRRG